MAHPEALEAGGDAALLAPPDPPFTALVLFVCTYVASLENLHMHFDPLTQLLCRAPHGCLLAVNSNFGHAAQPGHEGLLKAPKAPPARRGPSRGRARKVQGDGSCFNSAVEPVIAAPLPGLPPGKVYFVKCFPTTGQMQVPGVIRPDLADGVAVLDAFVAYLNEAGAGDPGPDGAPLPVTVAAQAPKMLNYKFSLARASPRVLVDLAALAACLRRLEAAQALEGAPPPPALAGWAGCVLPPFLIRETKAPADDVKISFRFCVPTGRRPRVNVFQMGKVNILGGDSRESALQVHAFFSRLFLANWAAFVCLQPLRDAERFAPAPAPAPPRRAPRPLPPSAAELADAADVLDALLAGGPAEKGGAPGPAGRKDGAGPCAPRAAPDDLAGVEALVASLVGPEEGWDWGWDGPAGGSKAELPAEGSEAELPAEGSEAEPAEGSEAEPAEDSEAESLDDAISALGGMLRLRAPQPQ